MTEQIKDAVELYQCPGCMIGGDISCYEPYSGGQGCGKHYAGTIISSIGKIFLGLPKGFCRLGPYGDMKPRIYLVFEDDHYNIWNVPVWKHLDEHGNTLVRGICPRTNWSFIDIILGDHRNKIECREISQKEIDAMD